MKRFLLGFILIFFCGCSPTQSKLQTPTPPVISTPPVSSSNAGPAANTAASTASPSPVPVVQICSPLEGIPIEQLAGMITNPYSPPPPGSDDPHAGIDLSDMLPETQISVSGRTILASVGGRVTAVIHDRFPYGNAVMIETSLSGFPADLKAALDLPTSGPTPVQPISLTCPNGIQQYADQGERSLYILYAHIEQPSALGLGEEVACGQALGTIGMTGNALNPHLHLEVRVGPSDVQFQSMAHYDASATLEEMAAYCAWRVGGQFQLLDPMNLFILNP